MAAWPPWRGGRMTPSPRGVEGGGRGRCRRREVVSGRPAQAGRFSLYGRRASPYESSVIVAKGGRCRGWRCARKVCERRRACGTSSEHIENASPDMVHPALQQMEGESYGPGRGGTKRCVHIGRGCMRLGKRCGNGTWNVCRICPCHCRLWNLCYGGEATHRRCGGFGVFLFQQHRVQSGAMIRRY